MMTLMEKALALRALQQRVRQGGSAFVIGNAWDRGSARLMAAAGFEALATSSHGFAHSMGVPAGTTGPETVLANAADIAAVTDLPVSADLERGLGDTPESAAETVRRAIAAGLAGASLEDAVPGSVTPIYDIGLAAEKIRAAAEAVRAQPVPFQLVARAENFLHGRPDLADTIRRLQAYQEAGADVLYAPGLKTRDEIRAVVSSVDRPVNVVMGLAGWDLTVADLTALGVARISTGSAPARLAYGLVVAAAREMLDEGRFTFAGKAMKVAPIEAMLVAAGAPAAGAAAGASVAAGA
ncbi:isocitrate lyase/phosphoenolpyruvate mutase family protein [Marinibaculum pumilum]|uniref:Isocitrate lyase/phosphoenolpyruvate mutase family protein n=1 Tax=Marinibaculum pumilum TaxID=1766165 RepID=A0ABV7L1Q4_9PROT